MLCYLVYYCRACAYGVEPLVEKLVHSGANVNATNSFGYSCMLEACHRGYIVVAKHLLDSGKVDLSYIPDEAAALNSPFASAPCQSALAEAARCGFFKVVQVCVFQALIYPVVYDLHFSLFWLFFFFVLFCWFPW
jgi:ankyrin repeat protein